MAKYIEREAALDIVNGWREQLIPTYGENDEYVKCLETVAEHLESLHAADVVPVRHGRWRKAVGTSGVVRMACTNCGFMRFPENDSREPMFAYCPNCGARMDGDGE